MSEYYVYILSREDGTPFYVGFGKGDRIEEHERACRSKNPDSHKNRIIRGILDRGVSIPKVKIAEGLAREEAVALEIQTIADIGREPAGPLVNETPGGDGQRDMTPELRRRISEKVSAGLIGNSRRTGIPHTEEARARIGESSKGRKIPKTSERMKGNALGNLNKGKPKSAEHIAKLKAAAIKRVQEGRHHIKPGHVLSPETISKIAAKNRERAANPDFRAKLSKAAKGRVFTPEHKAKLREARRMRAEREAAERKA